jgi:hypothetical protein
MPLGLALINSEEKVIFNNKKIKQILRCDSSTKLFQEIKNLNLKKNDNFLNNETEH